MVSYEQFITRIDRFRSQTFPNVIVQIRKRNNARIAELTAHALQEVDALLAMLTNEAYPFEELLYLYRDDLLAKRRHLL